MCSLRVLKCWKRRNIRWPPSGTHGITHSSGVWNEKRRYSCFINCYYYLDTSAALSLFMLRRTGWVLDSISFSWTLHQAQINERLPFLAPSDIVTWGETESRNVVLSTEAGETVWAEHSGWRFSYCIPAVPLLRYHSSHHGHQGVLRHTSWEPQGELHIETCTHSVNSHWQSLS